MHLFFVTKLEIKS